MEFITSLLKPETLLSILVALAVFGTIFSILMPYLQGDKLETRLKAVTSERERLRVQSRAALEEKGGSLRRSDKSFAGDISKKLNLAKMLEDPNAAENLNRAGWRGPAPLSIFYFARLILPFVGLLLTFVVVFYINDFGMGKFMKYGSLAFGMAAGFYAPNIIVSNRAQQRQKSIVMAFPDALDMLLICVEAGMSIEMGFQKVGNEIGSASAELAEELALTTAELSYLPERRQAYDNLAARTGHEGIKGVCMALAQAERYGTPLGDALRVMANENREMRMSAAEKKAAALPAKLTVPMIVFFLPVLFLVVLGPAYINYKGMNEDNSSPDGTIASVQIAPEETQVRDLEIRP